MFGAHTGGDFFGRPEPGDFEVDGKAVRGERLRPEGNAHPVADTERPEIFGAAFGDGHEQIVGGKEGGDFQPGRSQRLLIGFMAESEVVGEEDHAGGIGVAEMDMARVGEGHGSIFGLGFGDFDSNSSG